MTSSNGDIFRVTGHLCGEFTGPRWIPRTRGQWRGALKFSLICVWINGWVNNREAGDLRRHHGHYDAIIMQLAFYDMLFTKTHVDVIWGVFMQAIVLFGIVSFCGEVFTNNHFAHMKMDFPDFHFSYQNYQALEHDRMFVIIIPILFSSCTTSIF